MLPSLCRDSLDKSKLFKKMHTVFLVFRNFFDIFKTVLIKQLFQQQGYFVTAFVTAFLTAFLTAFVKGFFATAIYNSVNYITHGTWNSLWVIRLICIQNPVVFCHHAQQLKRFLHVVKYTRLRLIVTVSLLLHKKFNNGSEITPEKLYNFRWEISNLDKVDFIVIDKRLKSFGDCQPILEMKRTGPWPLVVKVEHQCYNRVALTIFTTSLCLVFCPVIANHTKRHIRVRRTLVLKADAGNTNVSVFQTLENITLLFVYFAISLVRGTRCSLFQLIGADNKLAIEQEYIHNVRKDIVKRLQSFSVMSFSPMRTSFSERNWNMPDKPAWIPATEGTELLATCHPACT